MTSYAEFEYTQTRCDLMYIFKWDKNNVDKHTHDKQLLKEIKYNGVLCQIAV